MAISRVPKIVLDDVSGFAVSRTPGPLGVNDHGDPLAKAGIGDTPGPLGVNDHAAPNAKVIAKAQAKKPASISGTWDPDAAVVYLKDPANGWAGQKPKHRCARAVRRAINAGGQPTPKNPVPAAEYKDYLPRLGFKEVPLAGYTPLLGDVAVFPAIADSNVYGHIEMYNGECWQSDYIQPPTLLDGKYGKGFFASRAWAKSPFVIFRRGGGK